MSTDTLKAVLRAGIYDRVSSDRRGTRRSVGEQNTENRQAADHNGWQVVAEYVDNDRSASRFARKVREDWESLVADLNADKLDLLIAWEPSRGSRDLVPWAVLLDTCRRKGVLIHITSHHRTYDVRQARDWRSLAEDGVDSAYESEKTHDRVTRTVRAQAAAGLPHGRCPWGYRREYDEKTGALLRQVPDEDTAPIIREAAQRFLRGEPLYSIVRDLHERGVTTPTGRPWEITRLRQILLSPTYAGLRVHQGKVIGAATWPPIIQPGVHDQLTARLTDPRRSTWVDGAVKHLLTGIAVCGVCEARGIHSTCRLIKNRGTPSYSCSRSHCVARAEWLVDKVVEDAVVERLSQPDAHDLLVRDNTAEVQAARDDVAKLRARLDAACDEVAAGTLSAVMLGRIEAKLVPQIEAADKRSKTVGISPLVAELIGDGAGERWDALFIPQKREVVRALMVPVIYKTVGGRRRDYKSVKPRWHEDPSRARQRSGNNE